MKGTSIRTFILITLVFFNPSSMALTITKDPHPQADPSDRKKRTYALVPLDGEKKNETDLAVGSGDSGLPLCVLYTGKDGKTHGYSPLEERRKQHAAQKSFLNAEDKLNWLWSRLRGSFEE
jgi:hypothetical protein